MFDRWRYRGRHRGYFPDYYRSVEAYRASEEITQRFIDAFEADIQRDIAAAHRAQIDSFLPVRRELIFDPPLPAGAGLAIRGLIDYALSAGDLSIKASLWLSGDLWPGETDPDEHRERLLKMAGA